MLGIEQQQSQVMLKRMKNDACTMHHAEAYRKAVDLNPKDYRAWYGLGQTYELLHMPVYALHYYQRATQVGSAIFLPNVLALSQQHIMSNDKNISRTCPLSQRPMTSASLGIAARYERAAPKWDVLSGLCSVRVQLTGCVGCLL